MPDELTPQEALQAATGPSGGFLKTFLFSNDIQPEAIASMADIVQPDFPGYAPIVGSKWDILAVPDSDVAEAVSPLFRFIRTVGPSARPTVYGYAVAVRAPLFNADVLIMARRFAEPVTLARAGATFAVKLKLTAAKSTEPGKSDLFIGGHSRIITHSDRIPRTMRAQMNRIKKVLAALMRRDGKGDEFTDTTGKPSTPFLSDALTANAAVGILNRIDELEGA